MKTRILFTSVVMLIMVQSSFVNTGTGVLKGNITDNETGKVIPSATVTLTQAEKIKSSTLSDESGNYQFNAVPPGNYEISASGKGYEKYNVKNLEISAGSVLVQNVVLKKNREMRKDTETPGPPVKKATGRGEISREKVHSESSYSTITDIPSDKSEVYFMVEEMVEKKSKSPGKYDDRSSVVRTVPQGKAGVLTAGELNDFNKWELWKDISRNLLNEWQEQWKFSPLSRYMVEVINQDGKPVIDAVVLLEEKNGYTVWKARTDNTGKAELWDHLFSERDDKSKKLNIRVIYEKKEYSLEKAELFGDAVNILKIPAECKIPSVADIMFVVDATGSMGDEIEYLKAELNDIIGKVKERYPSYRLNLGSVFYRDKGDIYITKKNDFSDDITSTVNFIKQQNAAGGGDMCEAVDSALDVATGRMNWSENAVARLLFLILDAPPHSAPENIRSLQKSITRAAEKGIRIIPVTGSGLVKSGEYLLRSMALATNGTYVFLTDHSGIGGSHLKPSTDEYTVSTLNDALLKIFYQFMFTVPCDQVAVQSDSSVRDTTYVINPKIIDHVIADSLLYSQYNFHTSQDTHTVSFTDTLNGEDSIIITTDSSLNRPDSINPGIFHFFRFYPNPTNGLITVEIKGNVKEIFLADISGKLLEKFDVSGQESLVLDISQYPTGIYFLQYFLDGKWLAGKVLLNSYPGNGCNPHPVLK